MSSQHCDGEHVPGEKFASGRMYCKRCGSLLAQEEPVGVTHEEVMDAITEKAVDWGRDIHGNLTTFNGE